MGLSINGVRFIFYARTLGVDFSRTAMIGRQGLHLSRRDLKDTFKAFRYAVDDELIDHIFTQRDGFAEQLLMQLGAREVHSFDISSYQGATHIWDMNKEIPSDFKEQYTTVLDGGSLEHIFNFPVALRNCMEMLEVGGHYLSVTPANNFMGHGFYQFSPEIYFRIFAPENGFQLINMIAFEDRPGTRWYSVKDPKEVMRRVELVNCRPVNLLVVAKRTMKTGIFETPFQQSDYLALWNRYQVASGGAPPGSPPATVRASLFNWIRRITPMPAKRFYRRVLQYTGFAFDRRFFQPFDPTKNKELPDRSL